MSPTCKLKTFLEYKALINFKFANKDSINRKISETFVLVLFACRIPSLLYKTSKRRKPLKPENLETIFLLSALKSLLSLSLATKQK